MKNDKDHPMDNDGNNRNKTPRSLSNPRQKTCKSENWTRDILMKENEDNTHNMKR